MKVKELPDQNAALDTIKVVIPATIPDAELNLIGLTQRDVYVTSGWGYGDPESSGIWVKTTPGGQGRIFPLTGHELKEVLDWELWEEGKSVPQVDPYDAMRCENSEKWKAAHVQPTHQ